MTRTGVFVDSGGCDGRQPTTVCGGSARILNMLFHIWADVPSNRRPHPIANSVSPAQRNGSASAPYTLPHTLLAGVLLPLRHTL